MKFSGFSLFEICIALLLIGFISLSLFDWQLKTIHYFQTLQTQGRLILNQANHDEL